MKADNGLRAPAMGAMLTLGLLTLLPYVIPGLERFRLYQPLPEGEGLVLTPPPPSRETYGETELPPTTAEERSDMAMPEWVPIPPSAKDLVGNTMDQEAKPPVSIVDPDGEALEDFFAALYRLETKQEGVVRAAMWGDSNVAGDLVTSVLRRKLQARFGDGGHGFVLLTRASRRYYHSDVRMLRAQGWAASRITGPLVQDGLYGLGGTSFRALGPKASSAVATMDEGQYGRKVSRFAIAYLQQPDGDEVDVEVDGEVAKTFSTAGDELRSAVATVEVPDGAHQFNLVTRGAHVRIFGVWLERDRGVVLDAVGVTNSKVRQLSHIDGDHFAEQLRLRGTSLMMFNFGVNEARSGKQIFGSMGEYERTMTEVLTNMQRYRPEASCLVVGPVDIGYHAGRTILSYPLIAEVNAAQRRVAKRAGCAFWDTREAMGGDGSMGRWFKKELGEENMLHPTKAGAQVLGQWLYLALLEQYAAFKRRQN